MTSIDLPLPNRSIQVAPRPFALPAAFLFSVLILPVLLGLLVWWQGPGLWRDWQINQKPVVVEDWDLVKGECSSRRGLTDCDAHVRYRIAGQDYEKDITLAFFDLSNGDYMVELVVDENDPELATLSLGLDMLWNRLITFSVFVLLFGGGFIAVVLSGLQTLRANRAAATPGRLSLVPVEISEVKHVRGRPLISYVEHITPRRKRAMRTAFAKGQEPLVGLDAAGNPMGVAVRLDQVSMPILLDSGLERIGLSDVERRAALDAFENEQQQRGGTVAASTPVKAKGRNPILRGLKAALGVLILAVIAFFGYWIYYVITAPDAFDSIGMELNNMLPGPLNSWGCEQLEKRFGDKRAPFGCTSADHVSWKTAPAGKIKN